MDLKALVEQIVTLYRKLNTKQQYAILGTGLAVVALISFLIVYSAPNTRDDGYRVLYEKLSPKDAGLIVQQLEKDQIEYKIPEDGTISVKKEVVNNTRMQMATQGLPKESKTGFELFDNQEFGATDFDQQVKYLRALEGELGRSIESLGVIRSAKVHIAIPKESVFVSKQESPTASVVLTVEDSQQLSRRQIIGIKHLVSSGVSRLLIDNVKIVDEEGIPLGEEDELSGAGELARMQLSYKRDYESIYEKKIVNMLASFIGGEDKVVAKVSIDFDFAQRSSVEEVFDPNNVPRSENSLEEKREGFKEKEIGGVPGAVSNIGPVQGLEDGASKEKYSKTTSTINYEVSKRVSNVKGEFATIKRVSAAVVVDGKYKPKKNDAGEVLEGEEEYIPLSATQLAQIEALVKQSIGYSETRTDEVTVSNFEFRFGRGEVNQLDAQLLLLGKLEEYLGPMYPVVKYLFIVLILLLFYKKVIVPFSQRMLEVPVEEEDIPEAKIEFDEDEIEDEGDKLAELRKRVEQQLGLDSSADEEQLKYDVLLERLRDMSEEKSEDLAQLMSSLISDELSSSGTGI